MQTYPDVLYPENKRQGNANYYNLFTFAALAQSEALLRFPTSQQADRWRWELGYNLARSSEPSAGEYYAGLIRGALNQGQTRPENLNEWFAQSERRMVLRPVVLEPVPGSISTTLIELQASGDAFLLLLETPRDFQAFSLASNFDFVNPVDYDFAVGDLTGDGSPEIILYPVTSAEGRTPPPVEVFDLSTSPPQGLNFRPTDRIAIGLDHVNRWTPIPLLSGRTNLQYTTTIFPPCPLEIKTQYHWDGTWFNAVDRTFRLQPDPELLSFCDTLLSHALIHWGPQVSSRLIESALEAVPAGETESALTAEMLDDWRFRLGVAYALAGDRPAAVAHLEDLIADPRGTEANSHSMAEEFLEIYETGAGLYVACEATPGCDPAMALERVIESLPLAEYPAVISQLVLARVPVRQSGFFDFDGDGETERWITVRPRGRLDLDFWILVRAPGRIDALLVDSVPGVNPDLSLVETPAGARVFQLGFQNSFSLDRLADTREPYLNRYQPELVLTSQLVQQQNKDALDRLLGGVDARQIRDELSRLQASPVFGCTFGTCPDFIYPLALAHELAGDERKAVDLYLELWRVYTKSPYTIMARLKLVGEALVPTETPTPTPTSTPTRTPTVTGTLPTATATQSVTPATSTPTGTVLPSPYP